MSLCQIVKLKVIEENSSSLRVDSDDNATLETENVYMRDKYYDDLLGKPQINDVELVGNKSLADLGITSAISAAITAYIDSGAYLIIAKLVENTASLVEYRSLYSPLSYNDLYAFLTDARPVYFLINGNIGHLEFAGEDVDNTYSVIISTNELNGVNKHYWFHASSQSEALTGALNPLTTYYGLGNGDVEKLNGIENGAQVNVQSDWDVSNPSSDSYIKNKPSIPTKTSDLSNDSDFATNNDVSEAISDYATPIVFKLTLTNSTSVTTNFKYEDVEAAITGSKPYLFLLYDALEVPIEYSVYTVDSYSRGLPGEDNILGLSELASGFSFCKIELTSTAGSSSNMSGILTSRAIPTKTSQLTNNSGFITAASLPTKTSDLTNDGADGQSTYVETDELSTVATSGSYNDLSNKPTIPAAQVNSDWNANSGVAQILNKPTIPTVNNATLTIQKNGSDVGTFTANASADKSINITVPTSAADVSALPASTKYGASVSVSINTTDYKITTTLKDQDGNTLGTAQVIDLPLESVVVNGTYDNTTKKVILTLQNGSTIEFSVADLVSGLQTEITSSNMLSADLVDDSSATHKFTTASDITKLSGIASGAQVNVIESVKVNGSALTVSSKAVDVPVPTKTSDLTNDGSDNTSTYLEADETAFRTARIPYGECDSTSTATAYTATVPGITELKDGVTMLLYNGVITSASGFTIDINGLGAKPSYSNMTLGNPVTPTAPTRDTTIFNINYAFLFVYSETLVSGGCWIGYRGYDANTNTIGYQLRSNNSTLKASAKFYRYRLLFTSADGTKWVPANTSSSSNATASREVNQTPIDPFGEIVWYGTTTAIEAGANVTAAQLWQEYYGTYTALGYSFNRTNAALSLTANKALYIKCAPQADGSAIIDANTPYVQDLPTTEDGKIYIFLGRMASATNFEILMNHPVYYYKGGGIKLWTGQSIPTKTSELTNDSGFITDAGVTSFNGSTGAVTYSAPVSSVNGQTGAVSISVPTKTSDLTNDSGFITDAGVTSFNGSTGAVTYSAPVSSVNGQTGAVTVTEGLAPLIGTTSNITPTQVKTAIAEGRDVAITHTSATYGVLKFCSFNSADTLGVVVSQTVVAYYFQLLSAELIGNTSDDSWGFDVHILAQTSDIPTTTSALTNDSGFLTSSNAVTSFNGSTGAVTYAAPVDSVNGQTGTVSLFIPSTTSELANDSGFITDSYHDDSKENVGKITISGTEYTVTRKALSITDNGVTTTYYVADIT